MNKPDEPAYARRFAKVLDFIDRHLDEPLPIERLCAVAHFSKFHFHRQFSAYAGVTPSRYVLLARLRRASYRLAFNPLERITDVALQAGFERPESFSRAFRQAFGQSPAAFRKQPDWAAWAAPFSAITRTQGHSMSVRIVNVEPVTVAALEHRGDPARLTDSVQRFIAWRKASGLSPVGRKATYGIAYDDPETTPAPQFRFDICGAVDAAVPPNEYGVRTATIPGGRCAVLRHLGSPDHIAPTVYQLYRDWLPRSGEQLRDFPLYFHYLNLRADTPEDELITEVHLPLR